MDFDELKQKWSAINGTINDMEQKADNASLNKSMTAQQHLIKRYRTFIFISVIFMILSPIMIWDITGNMAVSIAFCIYFVMAGSFDYILYRKVIGIDLSTMPVATVAKKALSCRRYHNIFEMILIPMAIINIIWLAKDPTSDSGAIWSMAIGGAVGLAIGLKLYLSMMKNYKKLISNSTFDDSDLT